MLPEVTAKKILPIFSAIYALITIVQFVIQVPVVVMSKCYNILIAGAGGRKEDACDQVGKE